MKMSTNIKILEQKVKKILIFFSPTIYFVLFMVTLSEKFFAAALIFSVLFCFGVARWWKTFADNKYDFAELDK